MAHRYALVMTLVLSVVALAAAGCSYDPLDSATQVPPPRDAIVGTWQIDEKGSDPVVAVAQRGKKATLILQEGGSFSARNLPYWWNDLAMLPRSTKVYKATRTLASASGKWDLVETRGRWRVTLDFPELPGDANGMIMSLCLQDQKAPYDLLAYLGDPDEARWLIFVRTGPASAASPEPAP